MVVVVVAVDVVVVAVVRGSFLSRPGSQGHPK